MLSKCLLTKHTCPNSGNESTLKGVFIFCTITVPLSVPNQTKSQQQNQLNSDAHCSPTEQLLPEPFLPPLPCRQHLVLQRVIDTPFPPYKVAVWYEYQIQPSAPPEPALWRNVESKTVILGEAITDAFKDLIDAAALKDAPLEAQLQLLLV